jgi:hypothetical protein
MTTPTDDDSTITEEWAKLSPLVVVRMHRMLAVWHAARAKEGVLDIVVEYHRDLAERLEAEAKRIPERGKGGPKL